MRLKVGADGLEPALARYERVVLTFELRTLTSVDYGIRANRDSRDAIWQSHPMVVLDATG